MIKDFFGKVVSEMQDTKKAIGGVEERIGGVEKHVTGLEDRLGDITIELKEFRTEQRQENKEMKQNIEMNTTAISGLTQELREIKKLEFDVYDHEKRITKLEKVSI